MTAETHTKIEKLACDVIEENGPLTAREVCKELYKSDKAYAMVDGQKRMLSPLAMDSKLSNSEGFNQKPNGEWEANSFFVEDPDVVAEVVHQ